MLFSAEDSNEVGTEELGFVKVDSKYSAKALALAESSVTISPPSELKATGRFIDLA